MELSRRRFVQSSLSFSALSLVPFRFALAQMAPTAADPIQRVGSVSSRDFNGDDVGRTHQILWDIEGYVRQNGGWPAPAEDFPVIVVGGGIAGLTAAYALRGFTPLILEQDRFFGGNSKGEQIGSATYGLGAAYIATPRPGSPIARVLGELGLGSVGRNESGDDTAVFLQNRFAKGFWHASTDPAARANFEQVLAALKSLNQRLEAGTGDEPWIAQLDRMTFAQWVTQTFGRVHPHILEYFQLYAWSSFAASIDELSAYQMLTFICAETASLTAFPGGNALIAQALHAKLQTALGPKHVRAGCMTVDVRNVGEFVHVTFVQPDGRLRCARAKAVVFAAPKFVATRVVRGLPADQARAMQDISYRGYVVANVVLDRRVASPSYGLYHLEGNVPVTPGPMNSEQRKFTDVIFAGWSQQDRADRSVLTVYKSYAYDGGRQHLFNPGAHDKNRAQILEGLQPLLASMGLGPQNIQTVRLTRWGHSLPVARAGLIASGVLEKSHQPVGGRIFFANQDNWANPSFETAFDEAMSAAAAVGRLAQSERRSK